MARLPDLGTISTGIAANAAIHRSGRDWVNQKALPRVGQRFLL